jgi:hypothetical protein
MTNPDVLAKRLLHRAHNRDGLPEILIGLLFFFTAGMQYTIQVLPHRSVGFKAAVLTFSFGFPAASFFAPRLLKWVRRRYLVEREGYVEHLPTRPSPLRRPWLWGVGAVLIVGAQVVLRPLPDFWVPGLTGVVGGFLACLCGRGPRFYFAGSVMAITGLTLALLRTPMEMAFVILFGILGVVEIISGTMVWMRFRAETNER